MRKQNLHHYFPLRMKKLLLPICLLFCVVSIYGQVGIGTTDPSASAMLEVSSTSDAGATYKGMMPPRVPNLTARDLINPSPADIGLLVFVLDIECLQMWNGSIWRNVKCNSEPIVGQPWINEFHYQNVGDDTDQFIEVAGPAGVNMNTFSIELYDGNTGTVYDTTGFAGGPIPPLEGGIGTATLYYINAVDQIQNGEGPNGDGIALINAGVVVQFLSYGGSFTANDGTAVGLTSIDIGIIEPENTPVGQSLQLEGLGRKYIDFDWVGPTVHSSGLINAGQTIN